MMKRCLECKFFNHYPFSEVEGYCEATGRDIRDPNMVCVVFVWWKDDRGVKENFTMG